MKCVPDELCWVTQASHPGNNGCVVRTMKLIGPTEWQVEPMGSIWVQDMFFNGWIQVTKPYPVWVHRFSCEDQYLTPFRNRGPDLQVPAPPLALPQGKDIYAWDPHSFPQAALPQPGLYDVFDHFNVKPPNVDFTVRGRAWTDDKCKKGKHFYGRNMVCVHCKKQLS